MKNLTTLSLLTATIIGLTGCGGGATDTTSNLTTSLSKISLSVSDASAGFLKEDVNVSLTGVEVTDINGNLLNQLELKKNSKNEFSIYLKSLPSQTQDLRIVADSAHYLATGTSLLIRPTQQDYSIDLKLVEERVGEVTQGVYMNEIDISSMVDSTGKVTQEIVLESHPGATPSTKITIPINTILKDKNGNPIIGGTLKVVGFDPSSQKALQAYPGGFNVIADATGFNGNGTTNQEINFKTAGFVAIEIKGESGNLVKTFSQPVQVAMQFKVGTTDGDGNVVQAGDAVPIWSYNEETGQWSYEKVGTAQINPNDSTIMDVVYTITHLSYYNLDWHYGAVCSANINVLDINGVNSLNSVHHLSISIPSANLVRNSIYPTQNNNLMVLHNVPSGFTDGIITAYDASGAILGSAGPTDLCNGTTAPAPNDWWSHLETYDNEVNLTIDTATTDVTVNMSFSCPNNINIPGFNTTTIPFNAVLSNNGNSVQLNNGSGIVTVSNNIPNTYDVTATSAQANLFAAIDPNNSNNPNNNQVTISTNNTTFNQTFILNNAFCNPLAGNINGTIGTSNQMSPAISTTDNTLFNGMPNDVVQSSNGNLYISTHNRGILKVTPNGTSSVFIEPSSSTNPLPTTALTPIANIKAVEPMGMDLFTLNGTEYLAYADYEAHCVNLVDLTNNIVSTVAGKCGTLGDIPNTIAASTIANSRLSRPADVAFNSTTQTLFIADYATKKVKMVDTIGNVWTVAGLGTTALSQNLTPALSADIRAMGLDVDSNNQVVVADYANSTVYRIEALDYTATNTNPAINAEIRLLAGSVGIQGSTGDGGVATLALLNRPVDIEVDNSDNILIADRSNHKIRRISSTTQNIDTVAGTGNFQNANIYGIATQQNIAAPRGIWVESNGDFYFTQKVATPSTQLVRHVTH